MTASELTEWIALFINDLSPDGQAGYRESIPDDLIPDRPANVRRVGGQEITSSDQIADRVRYEITIRYEPGITSKWRVLWRDQLLDVTADPANVDMADTWLRLTCERKEAGRQ